jgi:hypothetical protein
MKTHWKTAAAIFGLMAIICAVWLSVQTESSTQQRATAVNSAPPESPTILPTADPQAVAIIPSPLAKPVAEPAISIAMLRQSVAEIIDPKADSATRLRAVRKLPLDLSSDERIPVIDFLRRWQSDDEDQSGQVLKNDLMDSLVAQRSPALNLADIFIEIYADTNQNNVIRDYAIQHLSMLGERIPDAPGWDASQVRYKTELILEALWTAAGTHSSIAGTALMGLARLSETSPSVDRSRLSTTSLQIAADNGANEAARISAIQVCAKLHIVKALPTLVQSTRGDRSVLVRVSAIGALGMIGGRDEADLLKSIAGGTDVRVKPVAETALRRIQQRTGENL